jgi:hypothetical protein
MKELRAMQKEEVEDIDAQNEATVVPDAHVQNEATAALASRNLSILNELPKTLNQPLTSRFARLNAAVEATLQSSANLRVRSVV